MSKAPSMPMYWDAYLADTTHLTTEEHGAYMLLLAAMWRRNGWVPDDDRDNARILGLTIGKWRKIKVRLSGFLMFREGEISQKKLLETWENTQEKIEKNRTNGAKGGRPKSSKNKHLGKANGSISDNPNESKPEPEPEPYRKEEGKPSSKTKRKTSMPEDAICSPELIAVAAEEGYDEVEAKAQFERFKSSAIANGRKYASWKAAWRNWFRSDYFRPIHSNLRTIHGGPNDISRSDPNFTASRAHHGSGRPGHGTAAAFATVAERMSRGA